jgi:hypothetical protein
MMLSLEAMGKRTEKDEEMKRENNEDLSNPKNMRTTCIPKWIIDNP